MNMATTIIVLTRKSNTMIRPSLSRLYHRYVSSSSSEISPAVSSSCTHMHSSLSTSRLIDYARGWAWQQTLLSRRLEVRRNHRNNEDKDNCVNDSDIVLILEHKPVYTLGQGADENNLTFLQHDKSEEHSEYHRTIRAKLSRSCRGADSARLSIDRGIDKEMLQRAVDETVDILAESVTPVIAPNDVPIYRVDRGGDVTWHGPGQLVVYPLLDLKRFPYRQDLHWYLRSVEDVILLTLQHYDIKGERDEINTGVWVGDKKIAAVGVSSSRWITTHGFALNVCPDLAYFDTSMILPCGIKGRGVTSIAEVLMQRKKDSHNVYVPTMEEVQTVVCQSLQEVFDMSLIMDCEENIVLS